MRTVVEIIGTCERNELVTSKTRDGEIKTKAKLLFLL
jgi:hypothetical protein